MERTKTNVADARPALPAPPANATPAAAAPAQPAIMVKAAPKLPPPPGSQALMRYLHACDDVRKASRKFECAENNLLQRQNKANSDEENLADIQARLDNAYWRREKSERQVADARAVSATALEELQHAQEIMTAACKEWHLEEKEAEGKKRARQLEETETKQKSQRIAGTHASSKGLWTRTGVVHERVKTAAQVRPREFEQRAELRRCSNADSGAPALLNATHIE